MVRVKRYAPAAVVAGIGMIAAYAFGAYSHAVDLWPLNVAKAMKRAAAGQPAPIVRYDAYGRVLAFPGKIETACPAQTDRTAVIVVFGGSNAGNWTGQRVASASGRAFNYLDGRCYRAASPLLGADNTMGEYWTLLADRLVRDGLFDDVVLSVTSVGGSMASDWAPGGKLAGLMVKVSKEVLSQYRPTWIVWDMGEDDHLPGNDPIKFAGDYEKIIGTLRAAGLSAPVYLTLATKCLPDDYPWSADNAIARAERTLPARIPDLSIGVDRDALLTTLDRRDDCHLGASGAVKMADAWFATFKKDR